MNKEKILAACLSATSVIFINSSMVGQGAKPNIVIILADDMGWGDVNANGNGLIETPVLNRFKDQSLSFDRFYVCPLSAPTRAEMLTGRYFLRTGVSSVTQGYENMRSEEITLAEILKENGYTTGCFGKWHNGGYFLQHPNRQGFEEYVGFCMGHLGYYFDGPFLHNDEEIKSEGYTTDFFTDKALEFIDSAQGYPFLCYLAYNVPHSPFQVPARYFDKYNSTGLDSTLSSVYGMVENMDYNIGRIIEKLEEKGITDNTIFIMMGDNGFFLGEHGLAGKWFAYNESVRVPLFIYDPQLKARDRGKRIQEITLNIDIAPTILAFAGIEKNKGMQGEPLQKLWQNPKPDWRKMFFYEHRFVHPGLPKSEAIISSDYKYIDYYELPDSSIEFYDLRKDPKELTNLFRVQGYENLIDNYRKLLDSLKLIVR